MERVKPLLLEGVVDVEDSDDPFPADLRKENVRLGDQVLNLRRQLEDAEREKVQLRRTILNLRKILSPLHDGMRMLFGEIEVAVGEESATSATSNHLSASPQLDARLQSFKNSFPGRGAEIIDALLVHGEMRISHLATLLRCDPRTIGQHAAKLRNAGAISQVAGMLSLKR